MVDTVPVGWHVSSATPYTLVISRDGVVDDHPNSFRGKLAMLTASLDQESLGAGDPVTVHGRPGRISRWPGLVMLRYDRPHGFGVTVQAPRALGWSDDELVSFAEGVHVTPDARQANG